MENSPSLRNRGPRGVQQLFLWTLWTNSTTSNDASMIWQLGRTRVLLSDPFEGQVGIWGYGASCISFSQFACAQWRDGRGILHAAGIGQWCWLMSMVRKRVATTISCQVIGFGDVSRTTSYVKNLSSGNGYSTTMAHFRCFDLYNYRWIWVTPCLSQ